MELEEALKEMREGKKIRRCDFEDDEYVFIRDNAIFHSKGAIRTNYAYAFKTADFNKQWEIVSEKLYILDVIRIIKRNMDKIDTVTLDESEITICIKKHEPPIEELTHFGICRMILNTESVWMHTIPLTGERELSL